MQAYVTKYALTKGIQAVDLTPSGGLGWAYYEHEGETIFVAKEHWHRTRAEAVAAVRKIKQRKILSLERQLVKIRSIVLE